MSDSLMPCPFVDGSAHNYYPQRLKLPCPPKSQNFDIDCTLSYVVNGPSDFIFRLHAYNGTDQQVLSESLVVTPALPHHVCTDSDIGHRFLRLHAEACEFVLRYEARVHRQTQPLDLMAEELPVAQLPDDVLQYLNPSRYCESDHLSQSTQQMFAHWPKGLSRVQGITDWIHRNITYQIGTSDAMTTARDVFNSRMGVCRDYAHLGITFCRALNIPARLVVGYASFDDPPPDFHAVFEAYLGHRWIMFDPTYMSPIDDFVRIADGKDAKDVAFCTIYGPATMTAMSPLVMRPLADI
jgi:transglutaminase-like putative cysteine protease